MRCFIGECNLVKIATFRACKISKEEDSFPNPEEQKKYTGFGLKSLILTPNFPKYFLKTLFLDISYWLLYLYASYPLPSILDALFVFWKYMWDIYLLVTVTYFYWDVLVWENKLIYLLLELPKDFFFIKSPLFDSHFGSTLVQACSKMSISSLMGTSMTWVHTCLGGVLFSHPIGTSYCPSPPIAF